MKAKTIPDTDKLVDNGASPETGYEPWKVARVRRALVQALDRRLMIDAETLWQQLDCDD